MGTWQAFSSWAIAHPLTIGKFIAKYFITLLIFEIELLINAVSHQIEMPNRY